MNSTATKFDWYEVVQGTDPLEQGDLLNEFPFISPPVTLSEVAEEHENREAEAPYMVYNVVVMTQSCDLLSAQDDTHIILCPRYPLSETRTPRGISLDNSDGWKKLTRGHLVGSHLINRCELENFEFDYQVIDLQRIFTTPYSIVHQIATKQVSRVRLLPPYREHLAQAFARQFMRVGLPIDLPQDYPNLSKKQERLRNAR